MVFGCKYNSTPRSTGRILPTWTEASNMVTADKLTQNKVYIGMLKDGYIHHYRNKEDRMLQTYFYHWQNVVIREEEDQDTGDLYQVIGRKGDDHFAQASVYALLGTERLRDLHSQGEGYGLYYDKLNTEDEPTKPDIYWQLGN